jgi:hypothetical protein
MSPSSKVRTLHQCTVNGLPLAGLVPVSTPSAITRSPTASVVSTSECRSGMAASPAFSSSWKAAVS